MRVPSFVMRSSWIVPSASGAASARLTIRCCSTSETPSNASLATVTWKWSPPPVRSRTSTCPPGKAARAAFGSCRRPSTTMLTTRPAAAPSALRSAGSVGRGYALRSPDRPRSSASGFDDELCADVARSPGPRRAERPGSSPSEGGGNVVELGSSPRRVLASPRRRDPRLRIVLDARGARPAGRAARGIDAAVGRRASRRARRGMRTRARLTAPSARAGARRADVAERRPDELAALSALREARARARQPARGVGRDRPRVLQLGRMSAASTCSIRTADLRPSARGLRDYARRVSRPYAEAVARHFDSPTLTERGLERLRCRPSDVYCDVCVESRSTSTTQRAGAQAAGGAYAAARRPSTSARRCSATSLRPAGEPGDDPLERLIGLVPDETGPDDVAGGARPLPLRRVPKERA